MNLNKGISAPIAILLIAVIFTVAGVLVWQFKDIESPKPKPTEPQATTSEEIILKKINKSLPEGCDIEYEEIEKENWHSNSPARVTLQKNICPEIKNYKEEKIWKAKKKISDNITAVSLASINLVTSEDYFICNYAQDNRTAPGIKELRDVCADHTANWETYTNEEYGFEFRYPSQAEIEHGEDWRGSYTKINLLSAVDNQESISSKELTIRKVTKNRLKDCYYAGLIPVESAKQGKVHFNEIEFCKSKEGGSGMGQTEDIYHYTTKLDEDFLLLSFSLVYNHHCGTSPEYDCREVNVENQTKTYSQILSTFEFTE